MKKINSFSYFIIIFFLHPIKNKKSVNSSLFSQKEMTPKCILQTLMWKIKKWEINGRKKFKFDYSFPLKKKRVRQNL